MKKLTILLITVLTVAIADAQELENLIPNPSFEELEKKVKTEGEVVLAAPWKAVNMNPVDLYSGGSKNDQLGVPENQYGEEKAKTGVNYAGVSFYGYRSEPRTYLGTELSKPLEAGKQYCVKFHVSLSDMSKYAVNNIGLHLSQEPITEMSQKNLSLEPQIMSVTNKVFDKQFLWTPVCGTYTAKGGEKFIVIGNFFSDDATKIETIRLSKGFSGRQKNNAYYFIDDVSIISTEKLTKKDCACDDIAGGAMEVEFKKFGTDESLKSTAKKTYLVNSDGSRAEESIKKEAEKKKAEPEFKTFSSNDAAEEVEEKVEEKVEEVKEKVYSPEDVVIYFNHKKFAPVGVEAAKLKVLAEYLKANTGVSIIVEGHGDPSEEEVKFIGKRRGFTVQKQLKTLGVSEAQLKYESKATSMPASDEDASKNKRVTFSIK